MKAEGGARFGPNGEMHILGGAFVPDGTFNKEIRDACKKSDQIAIEAIVDNFTRSSIRTRTHHQSVEKSRQTKFHVWSGW